MRQDETGRVYCKVGRGPVLTTACHRDGTVSYRGADGVWHERVAAMPEAELARLPVDERGRIPRHCWRGMGA